MKKAIGLLLMLFLSLSSCSGGGDSSSSGGNGSSNGDYNFLYEHNAQYLDGRTIRWNTPVPINSSGLPRAEEAVARWGVPYTSGNGVTFGWFDSNTACGITKTYFRSNGEIIKAEVFINRADISCPPGYFNTLTHEVGHALGFFGHTDDSTLMGPFGGTNITPQLSNMMGLLYSLPIGTDIRSKIGLKSFPGGRFSPKGDRVYEILSFTEREGKEHRSVGFQRNAFLHGKEEKH